MPCYCTVPFQAIHVTAGRKCCIGKCRWEQTSMHYTALILPPNGMTSKMHPMLYFFFTFFVAGTGYSSCCHATMVICWEPGERLIARPCHAPPLIRSPSPITPGPSEPQTGVTRECVAPDYFWHGDLIAPIQQFAHHCSLAKNPLPFCLLLYINDDVLPCLIPPPAAGFA